MNPRERNLLIVIGAVLGAVVLYNGVNYLFVRPVVDAAHNIEKMEKELAGLNHKIQSRRTLARRWQQAVRRMLAFDRSETVNRFSRDVKALAERHGFASGFFSETSGTKIGNRTNIGTVAYRIVADGKYPSLVALAADLHRAPYLCAITRLSVNPLLQKGRGRDEVKFDLTVETPLPPRIDRKLVPEAATATTLPADGDGRGREAPDEFPVLASRNIFRPYVAPPTNVVLIDNQDWAEVKVSVRFHWDGKTGPEVVELVPARQKKPLTGQGDAAEVAGTYADGVSFGPRRLDAAGKGEWIYTVATHSPPPPPDVIDLAVDNHDQKDIDLQVSVIRDEGPPKVYPTMRIKAATAADIDRFIARSVTVSATYASGRQAAPMTFVPGELKQTYTVPIEPVESADTPPPPRIDPPPDPALVVSALLTYQGTQEMIATGGAARKIIRAGEEAAVDGGRLLGVHPLGGVVKMPTGNYYIYPLGRKFTERVRLEAAEEGDLAAAIDAWTRQ